MGASGLKPVFCPQYAGLAAFLSHENSSFLVRPLRIEMSMLDFFVAALSLASVVLLLLFWRLFPRDCGVHPIYRVDGIETIDEELSSGRESSESSRTVPSHSGWPGNPVSTI